MDEAALRALLDSVASGAVAPEIALRQIKHLDVEDLGFARIDHHRLLRRGFPEVIYSPGKTAEEVAIIGERLAAAGQSVLATRLSPEQYEALRARVPDAVYHERARCAVAVRNKPPASSGL
ncbi:MAG TPA: 1-(5-phosphoribosyl)-5-amino-4-imidazole-carboxylate carboxylase, partial [Chloroflexota bacterium]|nr:1-(5-phosphoribosyl)-5-amino-4-imidazole-carboxylate carboxylase [Chloroflexota bacterium]